MATVKNNSVFRTLLQTLTTEHHMALRGEHENEEYTLNLGSDLDDILKLIKLTEAAHYTLWLESRFVTFTLRAKPAKPDDALNKLPIDFWNTPLPTLSNSDPCMQIFECKRTILDGIALQTLYNSAVSAKLRLKIVEFVESRELYRLYCTNDLTEPSVASVQLDTLNSVTATKQDAATAKTEATTTSMLPIWSLLIRCVVLLLLYWLYSEFIFHSKLAGDLHQTVSACINYTQAALFER